MPGPTDYRYSIERRKGQRDQVQAQIRETKRLLTEHKQEEQDAEKARVVVQLAGKRTQEQLRYHLSEIARLALAAVFSDPYDFEIAFETRRGRTEADFWFLRAGERIDPRTSSGLGAVDIAGLALRVSLWSLRRPRSLASIWVDEPLKHLKGTEPNQAALEIFHEICLPNLDKKWPGLQVVMVADERASREDLREVSDKIFEFSKKGKETSVREIEGSRIAPPSPPPMRRTTRPR